ncbi:nucleoside triphosphate pyrophosphohydrolase [Marinomonas agarivorans]|nr:nucleoside triphosphate pyrophosphohydrolase [Marinomonas agarivorans]
MSENNLATLLTLVANLRAPEGGCPWDKKQTHQTLTPYLIEEAYEVLEAIQSEDDNNLKEELGDVLFQLVLHSQLAAEKGDFTFNDVIATLVEKMLRRHPHVFPDGTLESFGTPSNLTTAEIEQQWQFIKQKEKAQQAKREGKVKNSVRAGWLDDVSASMPPMQVAVKLQKKAAEVGFDWPDIAPVFAKIREELDELEQAIGENNSQHIQEELGDLLFAMANVARHLKVNPEQAVSQTNQKFRRRFTRIEAILNAQHKKLQDCDLTELDQYWEQAKAEGL